MSARAVKRLHDPEGGESDSPEAGRFVLVRVKGTNESDESRSVTSIGWSFVASTGDSFEPYSGDIVPADGDWTLPASIGPHLSQTHTVVFDVPPSALEGAALRFFDQVTGDEGAVALRIEAASS